MAVKLASRALRTAGLADLPRLEAAQEARVDELASRSVESWSIVGPVSTDTAARFGDLVLAGTALTVRLPRGSKSDRGRQVGVKRTGSGTVTILTDAAIDGAETATLASPYAVKVCVWDGSAWWVV